MVNRVIVLMSILNRKEKELKKKIKKEERLVLNTNIRYSRLESIERGIIINRLLM